MEGPLGAADDEVPPRTPSTSIALDFTVAMALGYSSTASMLSTSSSFAWAACCERVDRLRLAEHADHQVDDVAAQLEHDAAAILRHCWRLGGRNDLAHHGVDLEQLAQPAPVEHLPQSTTAGL